MVLNIKYVDKDYNEQIEEDEVVIGLKDEDFNQFLEDFYNFSNLYMDGYEIGEILDEENWKELLEEEYPSLSKEDAEYFANERENGLSGGLVVTAFLEKYPQYDCECNGRKISFIDFSEYDMVVDGLEYIPDKENSLEM